MSVVTSLELAGMRLRSAATCSNRLDGEVRCVPDIEVLPCSCLLGAQPPLSGSVIKAAFIVTDPGTASAGSKHQQHNRRSAPPYLTTSSTETDRLPSEKTASA